MKYAVIFEPDTSNELAIVMNKLTASGWIVIVSDVPSSHLFDTVGKLEVDLTQSYFITDSIESARRAYNVGCAVVLLDGTLAGEYDYILYIARNVEDVIEFVTTARKIFGSRGVYSLESRDNV